MIYRDFRAIEPSEWRTVVRYYEEYEHQIRELALEEYFELLLAYTNALFEIGKYEKHLEMADVVIETSMLNNIKFFGGEDVFLNTLFKKAASCYHLRQLEQADYILREMLKIDPFNTDASQFLKKCLRRMRPSVIRKSRALAVLLFIVSALIICVEMLLVRVFYPDFTDLVMGTRTTIFFLGIGSIIGGDVYHRWYTHCEVDRFVDRLKFRKK